MNCPKCNNPHAAPRRCPNCGHRWAHDSALAAEIDLRSKNARALLPQPEQPRNIVEFSTGKAVRW